MTNLIFCMWIPSLWLIILTADELRYFTVPMVGCFQTLITARFLQSWVAKRDIFKAQPQGKTVCIYYLQAENDKLKLYNMLGEGRDRFDFSTRLHMPSPLVPYFIPGSLNSAWSPLPWDPLHPFLPPGLAGKSVWFPMACGLSPPSIFSCLPRFYLLFYFVDSCSFIDSRPLIEQWSNKKTPGINMTREKRKRKKEKRLYRNFLKLYYSSSTVQFLTLSKGKLMTLIECSHKALSFSFLLKKNTLILLISFFILSL